MLRIVLGCCFLFFMQADLSGQFKEMNRPDARDRFIAFIAPSSTTDNIIQLLDTLEGTGFKISISQLIFTDQGQLKSFHTRLVSNCDKQGYTFEGTTDFSKKNVFPIAGLFIGEDCSAGVFTVPFENVKTMYTAFFPTRDPEYIFYGWDGDFNAVKDVAMGVNFTISSTQEH